MASNRVTVWKWTKDLVKYGRKENIRIEGYSKTRNSIQLEGKQILWQWYGIRFSLTSLSKGNIICIEFNVVSTDLCKLNMHAPCYPNHDPWWQDYWSNFECNCQLPDSWFEPTAFRLQVRSFHSQVNLNKYIVSLTQIVKDMRSSRI